MDSTLDVNLILLSKSEFSQKSALTVQLLVVLRTVFLFFFFFLFFFWKG